MRLSVYVRLMLALVAGAVLPGPGVQAEELRLIGASVSFYCYPAAGQAAGVSGLACDLVQEMARRVGHLSKIQLYPLPRATWNGILAARRGAEAGPDLHGQFTGCDARPGRGLEGGDGRDDERWHLPTDPPKIPVRPAEIA